MPIKEELSRKLKKVLELDTQLREAREASYDFLNASNKKEEEN